MGQTTYVSKIPHASSQASFAKQMRTALFWAITNFLNEVSAQRIGPILKGKEYKKIRDSMIQDSWPLRMGPIGSPETSVRNYHCKLRNSPEDRSSQNESRIARCAQMKHTFFENTKLVTRTFSLKENRTYIHTYIHTYINTHTYIHTYTHIHTYIHESGNWNQTPRSIGPPHLNT